MYKKVERQIEKSVVTVELVTAEVYEASDGKIFHHERDVIQYEADLEQERLYKEVEFTRIEYDVGGFGYDGIMSVYFAKFKSEAHFKAFIRKKYLNMRFNRYYNSMDNTWILLAPEYTEDCGYQYSITPLNYAGAYIMTGINTYNKLLEAYKGCGGEFDE